jgi:hypothetical protein
MKESIAHKSGFVFAILMVFDMNTQFLTTHNKMELQKGKIGHS